MSSQSRLSRAPAMLPALSRTACRHAPGSAHRGDGAALRCRHGSGDSWGTPGKISCRVLPVARARTRSPRLGALGLRPADLPAAALGGRPRPRLAVAAFAPAGAVDVVLLAGGVLPTRASTRSAVSRSVSRVATDARSVSRRASRSLIFVFSALIWSKIVGVVVGMVAFGGVRLIGMINLLASKHPDPRYSTAECAH